MLSKKFYFGLSFFKSIIIAVSVLACLGVIFFPAYTEASSFTVIFQADAGGTISGSTSQSVNQGDSTAAVTAIPNSGYMFANWTGADGFTSTNNPLTVANVTSDMTITANFQQVVGTPNWDSTKGQFYSLYPLYDGDISTFTELDEVEGGGYFGVIFGSPAEVSGVRFYSYAQDYGCNHITKFKVWILDIESKWIEVVTEKSANIALPGWTEAKFSPRIATQVRVIYTEVSYGGAPKLGEVEFLAIPSTRNINLTGNLHFGDIQIGSTSQKSFTIQNIGNAPLSISSIIYPTGFIGDWNKGTIAAASSQIINVTFTPTAAAIYGETLTVNSDKTAGINTMAISGKGTGSVTHLSGNLDFGDVEIGKTKQQNFSISNTGNMPLNVSSISYPAGFSGNWNGQIQAGGSQIVTATFTPTLVQTYSGTVTVNSDKTSGIDTITASGRGIPTRIINLSGNLVFENVGINTTKRMAFTIQNIGNSPLTVSSITYPTGFTGNWIGGTIVADGSQEVSVTFAPKIAQIYTGIITVNSDKTSGINTISVSGTGIVVISPPNDNFASAAPLSGNTGKITGNNKNATQETGEPDHASKTGDNSVWWTWMPSQSGTVIFDTCGSDFDTVIAVYTGASVGTLTKLADNDDSSDCGNKNSKVSVNVQADIRYYIAVAGYEGNSGNIVLNWKLMAFIQPVNDNFDHESIIKGIQGSTVASNINATKESGEPNHAGNPGGKSVWWTWTPEKSGTTSVKTQGSSFDTLLAVYTGTDLGNLSLIAANDNEGTWLTSAVSFNAVAGTPYHIAVDGSNGAAGNVILNWNETPSPAPSNDNFVNAVKLTGTSGQAVGSNINATKESGEPNHIYKSVSTSVWWSWTAGKNGTLSVDTHGSNFDTILTVFTGSDVAHLTLIAGNDDDGYSNYNSGLSFEALAGTTYYFAVSGYENRIGNVVLNWRQSGIILKSVSSTTGVSGQPLSIDLNGSGFSSATQLWIGKDGGFTAYPVTYKNSALLSATLTITIPGLYSIKVSEGTETATLADALTISDPDASKLIKNKAIIVNSRGPGGDISAMTRKCSEAAYQSLKWQGFTDNDIFFLTYETTSEGRDADPDYRNLKAVFDYLISNPPYNLIVYMVGHGDKGIFWLNTSERISASDLNKWLDTVQKGMAGTLAFVYDACFSGSFIPYLKSTDSADGKSRIVITSSQADENSAFDDNGFSSFSYHFWTSVWSGDTLKDAFYHAKNKMENYQTPLLDADRDGIPGETQDYTLAAIYIGRKAPVNPNIPVISNYSASLQGNSVLIRASIDRSVQSVWAIIIPPDYSYDPAANNSLPIIPMNPSGYLQFEKTYSPLDKKGTYIVGIYAQDASGNNAVPKYVAVTQTVGTESSKPDIYDQHIPSDNLPQNAPPILPNDVAQSHNFHAAGDQDWVKFYGVANTSYKINAGSPGIICNPVIRLYAEANTSTPIASSDSGLAGEPESLSWRCTQSGAYYVMVKNADGNVFGENARYALSLIIAEGPPEFWIQMYVRNVGSGLGIADATIQSSELDILIYPGMPDYPYLGDGLYQFKAAGQAGSDFGMNVSSGNYIPFSSSYTIENSRMVKSISIGMIPTDLSGVITVLRILSGISPVLPGFSQEVGGDISGDGKVGSEEVIYVLQKVAGRR